MKVITEMSKRFSLFDGIYSKIKIGSKLNSPKKSQKETPQKETPKKDTP